MIQAAIQVDGLAEVARSAAAQAELHLQVFDLTATLAVVDQLTILRPALTHLAGDCLDGLVVDHERAAELATFAAPTKASR